MKILKKSQKSKKISQKMFEKIVKKNSKNKKIFKKSKIFDFYFQKMSQIQKF